MTSIKDIIMQRKSIRAYLNKEVTSKQIIEILDAARYSPSGTNTQPWQVAVVKGGTKTKLDKALDEAFWHQQPKKPDYNYYPNQLNAIFKRRRIECGALLYETLGINRTDKDARLKQWSQNYNAFGAPVVLYIFADNSIDKGSFMDCGMFIQSIMLMATSMGLATCPQASLAEYPDIVRKHLNYPKDNILLCGIALGYADEQAAINSYRTKREGVTSFTNFFD